MPKVSSEHRAARREQILAAAIGCVAREGFHKTTMTHVIEASGLSAGAVYGYYRGKAELIRAIAERAVGSFAAILDEVVEAPGPVTPAGALASVLGKIEEETRRTDGALPRVAVHAWSEAARDDEVRRLVGANLAGLHRSWMRVIERCVSDGSLPTGIDVDAAARAMLGLMPGFMLQGPLLGDVDLDSYVAGFVAVSGG